MIITKRIELSVASQIKHGVSIGVLDVVSFALVEVDVVPHTVGILGNTLIILRESKLGQWERGHLDSSGFLSWEVGFSLPIQHWSHGGGSSVLKLSDYYF